MLWLKKYTFIILQFPGSGVRTAELGLLLRVSQSRCWLGLLSSEAWSPLEVYEVIDRIPLWNSRNFFFSLKEGPRAIFKALPDKIMPTQDHLPVDELKINLLETLNIFGKTPYDTRQHNHGSDARPCSWAHPHQEERV